MMIGILILTHGKLAQGYVSALNLIMGDIEKIDTLSIFHETGIDEYKEGVAKKITSLDDGNGVLVFCDVFGASPYNVTAQNFPTLKTHVIYKSITGVNLPMLIEAVGSRDYMPLEELSKYVQKTGKDGIKELTELMKGRSN